jgi:hypothetical protein
MTTCTQQQIDSATRWAKSNPERRKEIAKKYKNSLRGQENGRNWAYQYKYGITLEQYNQKVSEQDNKCHICTQTETATLRGKIKRLAVDHCHKTGHVRKLLCDRCNSLLGIANDDLELLQKAINYIKDNHFDNLE